MSSVHTCNVFLRGVFLFFVGAIFTLVFKILQLKKDLNPSMASLNIEMMVCSTWWVPTICGSASAFVGILYPHLERKVGVQSQSLNMEWSTVMRCVAFFVGINHASVKLHFISNTQLALTVGIMSLFLWWIFDGSIQGFLLGIGSAVIAFAIAQLLVYNEICRCSEADYLFICSWLPCAFFSGGVTVGIIGKQLAYSDYSTKEIMKHHIS